MPIKTQSDLPAKEILERENIFVMEEGRAIHQDIRPIKIGLLNLMPLKEDTELPSLEAADTPEQTPKKVTAFEKYAEVYAQNSDLVGWISIPSTRIDYPVMQSSQEEPDYYLKHDFDKNDDLNGTLFIDARNDYINRDTNIIIYGHNMKSGMMFGELKKYLDEDFYNAHKTIEFNTLYERGVYEVIEVGLSEVQYQDENVFRYYNFLNADSEEEYQEYLNNVAQLSVYGTEIDSTYGDQLLTLSTCNNYTHYNCNYSE